MGNNNRLGKIGLISNSHEHKIDIYGIYLQLEENCKEEYIYILRRRKDQKLICKVDKHLNMIGEIANVVLTTDLEMAYDRIKRHHLVTGWVDDYFDNID